MEIKKLPRRDISRLEKNMSKSLNKERVLDICSR